MARNKKRDKTAIISSDSTVKNEPISISIENKEIDLESLYTQIYTIAEKIIDIYALEKNINQKSTIIGKAMVAQTDIMNDVANVQQQIRGHNQDLFEYAKEQQSTLNAGFDNVRKKAKQFHNVGNRQQKLAGSLTTLQQKQQAFVEHNVKHHRDMFAFIAKIKDILIHIQTTTDNMTIEDQVEFVCVKMEELQKTIMAYITERSKIQALMNEQMMHIKTEITQIKEEIDTQTKVVQKVGNIAAIYAETTIQLCEKIDNILLYHQIAKTDYDMSLETMFGADEQTEFETKPKKKGFFARLFGR